MKAAPFLDMATLATASARTDKEAHDMLSRLLLLYNSPPRDLGTLFSNLHRLDICPDDYFDENDNTLHLESDCFTLICNGKQYRSRAPENINVLIMYIRSFDAGFSLEFDPKVVEGMGLNHIFKDLKGLYGL